MLDYIILALVQVKCSLVKAYTVGSNQILSRYQHDSVIVKGLEVWNSQLNGARKWNSQIERVNYKVELFAIYLLLIGVSSLSFEICTFFGNGGELFLLKPLVSLFLGTSLKKNKIKNKMRVSFSASFKVLQSDPSAISTFPDKKNIPIKRKNKMKNIFMLVIERIRRLHAGIWISKSS